MTAAAYPRLLADVGATHARFASQVAPGAGFSHRARYACADFETLWDAVCHHLWREGLERPLCAAVGIATPITGDHVRMTNHRWSFSIRSLRAALGLQRLVVVNDFTALALALPTPDCRQVGGGAPVEGAAIGLLGPGTGLGVSGLLPAELPASEGGPLFVPLGGEGGHVSLSISTDPEEMAVQLALQRRFGHVSAEQALSRQGLENLYLALAEVRGEATPAARAAQITAAALHGDTGLAGATLQIFCSLLGNAAGNLALTLGARGGVYIAGGLVPKLGEAFDCSRFRESFEAKGRLRGYLSAIPTYVMQHSDDAALAGAARALDQALRTSPT
jgi:glucokinase